MNDPGWLRIPVCWRNDSRTLCPRWLLLFAGELLTLKITLVRKTAVIPSLQAFSLLPTFESAFCQLSHPRLILYFV